MTWRNDLAKGQGPLNGFYVFDGKGVVIREPAMRKSAVARFVPTALQGYRYQTYVTGQTDWDDRPLYLFDEWVAYTNGGEVGVDLVQAGLWNYGWRDAVSGQIEFVVYSIATAMAVQAQTPEFLQSEPQFLEFLKWYTERAMRTFKIGSKFPEFTWDVQDKYWENIKTHPSAKALRDFVIAHFGEKWAKEVLEIEVAEPFNLDWPLATNFR